MVLKDYFWQYIFTSRAWNIFQIKTANNLTYTLVQKKKKISVLGFIKYSLTSSPSQNFIPPNLCLLFLLSPILNISIVSFFIILNWLNALSACHKLVPIGNAQNVRHFLAELTAEINTVPQHHWQREGIFNTSSSKRVSCRSYQSIKQMESEM